MKLFVILLWERRHLRPRCLPF